VPATLADAAPPESPGGKNINPGESSTMVQMVAEEVIVDVGATRSSEPFDDGFGERMVGGYRLAYNCTFWMVNQGSKTEQLAVRFPIRSKWDYGVITIQSIKIDGDPVPWLEDGVDMDVPFNWAHFNVTFPPGEEVEIKVTYTSFTNWYKGFTHEWASYTLETGAGWYGPIGQGRIILRLPYQATEENIVFETSAPGGEIEGADVVWEFENLEPTGQDNWYVQIIDPDTWISIVADRKKLESSPNNSAALIRLAEAIFYSTVEDREGTLRYQEEMFQEGMAAIAKAVELQPDDLELRAMYIQYLAADFNDETYALFQEQKNFVYSVDPDHYIFDYNFYGLYGYTKTKEALQNPPVTTTPENTDKPTQTSTQLPAEEKPTNTPEASPLLVKTSIPDSPLPEQKPVNLATLLFGAVGVGIVGVALILGIILILRRKK
jgi:hypothetical protein